MGAWVVTSNTRTVLLRPSVTNARFPTKTTSAGSFLARSVSTTIPRETDTTLTLSDTWLTTQASSSLTAWTDTGSIPTGISRISWGAAGVVRSKMERRASAVFTTKAGYRSDRAR